MAHMHPSPRRYILLALLLSGCAHSLPFNSATPEGRAEVNVEAANKLSVITLTNGGCVGAKSLRLGTDVASWDVASWIDVNTGQLHTVPLSEVYAVYIPDRESNSFKRFMTGASIGAAIGFLAIAIEGGGSRLGGPSPAVAIGGTALVGGAIGTLLGMESDKDVYVLQPAPTDSGTSLQELPEENLVWCKKPNNQPDEL
jgi:hypothetical protein